MNIIKLYKVITSDEATLFDIDFIRKLLTSYDNYVSSTWLNEPVNNIGINYSDREWKTINSFFHHLSQRNREIVYLNAISKNEKTSLIYTNNLLNQIKPDYWGLIELIIQADTQNMDNLYSWIKTLITFFSFDYGYCFNLQKNQSLFSEIIDNRSFFASIFKKHISHLAETERRNKDLLQVKQGIIPQMY